MNSSYAGRCAECPILINCLMVSTTLWVAATTTPTLQFRGLEHKERMAEELSQGNKARQCVKLGLELLESVFAHSTKAA
jgi:hypothetical protein